MANRVAEHQKRPAKGGFAQASSRQSFVEWNWFAGGALRGCGLCRERHWLYCWDDASGIYLLDVHGTLVADPVRAPKPLVGLAAADTGDWFVAICKSGYIYWLDAQLRPKAEMHVPIDPVGYAVEPFGDYAVVGGAIGLNFVCARSGRKLAEFETTRPLRFLEFVPNAGTIVGVSEDGLMTLHDHRGNIDWTISSRCNAGSLAVDGDGSTILVAGYGHGIVRFNGAGEREGVYRYDDSPQLVAMDAGGEKILAASLERTLTDISYDGVVRASRSLPDKPLALCMDPLARYAALAFGTGELRFLNVPEFFAGHEQALRPAGSPKPTADDAGSGATRPIKTARWETRAAQSTEEVDSALMEPLRGSPLFAVYTNSKKLRVYDGEGQLKHESESIAGLGRSLFIADDAAAAKSPVWLAVASDGALLGYNPLRNESRFWEHGLAELSHVQLMPKFGEALIIEACEYMQRIRFPDTVVWKKRLEYRVEAAAVGEDGLVAVTLDDRNLMIYDEAGKPFGKYRSRKPEPMQVLAFVGGWMTLARQERVARGHDRDGSILWATPLPWAPWKSVRRGSYVFIASEEGRVLVVDASGAIVEQSDEGRDNAQYFLWQDRVPARLFQVGETLIANSLAGKLLWRHTDDHRIGGFRASAEGVWVFLGRLLTFFEFK